MQKFSVDNIWFGECVRKIDISYIGKQLSLKYATQIETNEFNNAVLKSAENKDIEKELETTKDILDEIDLKLDK